MIIDARELNPQENLKYDVCIVGSGPAGITLALNLENTKKRICILEAGGFDHNPKELKRFYSGENVGLAYNLVNTRARLFGGTSHRWFGYCALLDPIDFEKKNWIPHSGWPLSRAELMPYYQSAHRLLDLSAFEYNPQKWTQKKHQLIDFPSGQVTDKIWYYHRMRFGKEFRKHLEHSENIDVYLNAMMTETHLSEDGRRAALLTANTDRDSTITVEPGMVVLACGGIENPRLLLAQRKRFGTFENSNIGQFFQEHPHYYQCVKLMLDHRHARSKIYFEGRKLERKETRLNANWQLKEALLRQERFQNAVFRIEKTPKTDALESTIRRMLELLHPDRDVFDSNDKHITVMSEQYPRRTSRVSLSKKRDPYGLPRAKLDFNVADEEVEQVHRQLFILAKSLGQADVGRLSFAGWKRFENRDKIRGGAHHMGTTRMATSPKDGVVDSNGKLFELDNFYIAGSSVFPTGGCVNPTLTILALTLRLAHHLGDKIR